MSARAPILLLACGNPSRGDDALGPACLDAVMSAAPWGGAVEALEDFQLQVEHALDIRGRERVVFIDASVSCQAPFEFKALTPSGQPARCSHALSPGEVLDTLQRIDSAPLPEAWVLAIRGEAFELGAAISPAAQARLAVAGAFLRAWLNRALTPLQFA